MRITIFVLISLTSVRHARRVQRGEVAERKDSIAAAEPIGFEVLSEPQFDALTSLLLGSSPTVAFLPATSPLARFWPPSFSHISSCHFLQTLAASRQTNAVLQGPGGPDSADISFGWAVGKPKKLSPYATTAQPNVKQIPGGAANAVLAKAGIGVKNIGIHGDSKVDHPYTVSVEGKTGGKSQETGALAKENQNLKEELNRAIAKAAMAGTQLNQANAQVDAASTLAAENEDLKAQLDKAHGETELAKLQAAEFQTMLGDKTHQNDSLKQELERKAQEVKEQLKKAAVAEEEDNKFYADKAAALEEKMKEKEKEIEAAAKSAHKQIEWIQKEANSKDAKIAELEAMVSARESEIDSMKKELEHGSDKSAKIAELETMLGAQRSEVKDLQKELEQKLEQTLSEVAAEASKAQEALIGQVEELTSKNQELKTKNQDLEQRVKEAMDDLNKLVTATEELKKAQGQKEEPKKVEAPKQAPRPEAKTEEPKQEDKEEPKKVEAPKQAPRPEAKKEEPKQEEAPKQAPAPAKEAKKAEATKKAPKASPKTKGKKKPKSAGV